MNAGADGTVALEEVQVFMADGPVDFHQMDISKADASVIDDFRVASRPGR